MNVTANMHNLKSVTPEMALNGSDTAWLEITAEDGSSFSVFMPYGQAAAMADAFNSYHASHLEPQHEAEGVPV